MSNDPIDRSVFLAWSGKPHNPGISHLEKTHSLPGATGFLLDQFAAGVHDPDTLRILQAVLPHRDTDPGSQTFGCFKWYLEDPAVYDTNASFFICAPLSALHLVYGDRLTADETAAVRTIFMAVLPWFRHMAEQPSLFYPNKCISDAAMLLAAGHVLGDADVTAAGRAFCKRYFDYYEARGTGWGEDHSPVYTMVIVEMTLLIMALEENGPLYDQARRMTDAIMNWVAFHDGMDAVPAIRTYNFKADIRVEYPLKALLAGQSVANPRPLLTAFAARCGYRFTPAPLTTPRERRWRTFDRYYSVSYVGEKARLGTLSRYPLMPNGYMHDGWGLGWQSRPASFILGEADYGTLEWESEDDEGVVRQHPAAGTIHDWASRHLFRRTSFHPDVFQVAHQHGRAAIVLREVHNLHSPTRRLEDRWRLVPGRARLLVNGREWLESEPLPPGAWIVAVTADACVAIRPLQCRALDKPDLDQNPQRRLMGNVGPLAPVLRRDERGLAVALPLIADGTGTITQRLLFSGWCIVLLDDPAEAGRLVVRETLAEDGQIPRTYGELVRTVELTTPEVSLKLVRDMLTGEETRFTNDARDPGVADSADWP